MVVVYEKKNPVLQKKRAGFIGYGLVRLLLLPSSAAFGTESGHPVRDGDGLGYSCGHEVVVNGLTVCVLHLPIAVLHLVAHGFPSAGGHFVRDFVGPRIRY